MDHQRACAYPFKFNHSWLENEDFVQMIHSEWPLIQSDSQMDVMYILSYKLRVLKDKVKSWTKFESLKMKDKSVFLEEEISSLLSSSHSEILNED